MSDTKLKIAIDCDDAAIGLKDVLFEHVKSLGYDIEDIEFSKTKAEGALYPEIGYNLAKQVQADKYNRGIILCGTGIGMSIVANKVKGIYAGLCHDVFSAERLRKSNDANVITMGERVIGPELAKMIITAFLSSDFGGGGSTPKVEQMRKLENMEM